MSNLILCPQISGVCAVRRAPFFAKSQVSEVAVSWRFLVASKGSMDNVAAGVGLVGVFAAMCDPASFRAFVSIAFRLLSQNQKCFFEWLTNRTIWFF
jgi:hypothetical protein